MFKKSFVLCCLFVSVLFAFVIVEDAVAQQNEQEISSDSSINQLFSIIRANLS